MCEDLLESIAFSTTKTSITVKQWSNYTIKNMLHTISAVYLFSADLFGTCFVIINISELTLRIPLTALPHQEA